MLGEDAYLDVDMRLGFFYMLGVIEEAKWILLEEVRATGKG